MNSTRLLKCATLIVFTTIYSIPQANADSEVKYSIVKELNRELVDYVDNIVALPNSTGFVVVRDSGFVEIYDSKSLNLIEQISQADHSDTKLCQWGCTSGDLQLSADGTTLAAGRGYFLEIWSLKTKPAKRIAYVENETRVRLNSSGSRAITFTKDSATLRYLDSGKSIELDSKRLDLHREFWKIYNADFIIAAGREFAFLYAMPRSFLVDVSSGQVTAVPIVADYVYGQHKILVDGSTIYLHAAKGTAKLEQTTKYSLSIKAGRPFFSNPTIMASSLSSYSAASPIWGFELSRQKTHFISYSDRDIVVEDLVRQKTLKYLWRYDFADVMSNANFISTSSDILLTTVDGIFLWQPSIDDSNRPTKIFTPTSSFITRSAVTPDGTAILISRRNNGPTSSGLTLMSRTAPVK